MKDVIIATENRGKLEEINMLTQQRIRELLFPEGFS